MRLKLPAVYNRLGVEMTLNQNWDKYARPST
jgi:hypothetical protein